MPIYEYKCESCGHQMEKLQKMSDPPLTTCPKCNNGTLKKMVSAAAFKLTGTGWYETDFKDKKPKTEKKSDKSDAKSTETKSGSDSKSDAKKVESASKTEKKPASSD